MTENNNLENNIDKLKDKIKKLQNTLDNLQHQHKKSLLEVKTELQFEKNRAHEFEEKYKSSIKYKNQQENLKKILNELDDKLSNKENQILDLMKADHHNKDKIKQLNQQLQYYQNNNASNQCLQLQTQLAKIQEAAVSAIVQKQNIISELEERLQQYKGNINMKQLIINLEQNIRQLEERIERDRIQFQEIIEAKDQQINQIKQKFQTQKQRSEERIMILEQNIQNYQAHIQKINEEKYQEESIEQKYYMTQDKLRKVQKKYQELQYLFKEQKAHYQQHITKLQHDTAHNKQQVQEIKELNNKVRQLEKENKHKKKEFQELKSSTEKLKNDSIKKYAVLQSQKIKIHQSYEFKSQELEKIKAQLQQRSIDRANGNGFLPDTDTAQFQCPSPSPKKNSHKQIDQASNLIDKLKNQIKDKQQNIKLLSKKLQEKTKQVQQMRQKLVSTSGSASISQNESKMMIEIEDLNSHIKKLENNLLINKLQYAQDESYWTSKQGKSKQQTEQMQRQFKKQKSQLLERIDRMKRNNPNKDNKMNYYQSSLK